MAENSDTVPATGPLVVVTADSPGEPTPDPIIVTVEPPLVVDVEPPPADTAASPTSPSSSSPSTSPNTPSATSSKRTTSSSDDGKKDNKPKQEEKKGEDKKANKSRNPYEYFRKDGKLMLRKRGRRTPTCHEVLHKWCGKIVKALGGSDEW